MKEVPFMSISKSFNKKNNCTYVYDVYENYWDKEKKKQVTKRRLIGKIDPVTGEMIPTRKRKSSPAAPENEPAASHAGSAADPSLTSLIPILESQFAQCDAMAEEISRMKSQIDSALTLLRKRVSDSISS